MFFALLLSCAHSVATELPEQPADAAAIPPLVAPRDPGFSMPVEARIEGLGSAGECVNDADCATAGCSAEVCVAAVRAPSIVTTCEILPVLSELKACTCQDTVCRWVHEAGARSLGAPGLLPALPPESGGGGGT